MDRWMDVYCGGLHEWIDGWMFAMSLIHATTDCTNHNSASVILFFLLFSYILYYPLILNKHSTYYPFIIFSNGPIFCAFAYPGTTNNVDLRGFHFVCTKNHFSIFRVLIIGFL